ncbi:MAG: electron transport complex subunit E [Haliscomenobacter sp.]|nr:electron transport complex subunit E [Haliscomenobacter sp.]MBK8878950.1 electron transport complex subunit E [Haliscomenobacter sp.]
MSEQVSSGQNMAVFLKGLWEENPIFVIVLGMCPTMAVTNTAINSLAMGMSTLVVLLGSSTLVSLFRKVIPDQVRITTYIVIIATFVTVIDFLLAALVPDVHKELGAFIPLIVVNCLILGRAEAFAARNPVGLSFLDALGMGLGFTLALLSIGIIREVLGSGSLFTISLFGKGFEPWVIMVLPPGGFLTLGFLMLGVNRLKKKKA